MLRLFISIAVFSFLVFVLCTSLFMLGDIFSEICSSRDPLGFSRPLGSTTQGSGAAPSLRSHHGWHTMVSKMHLGPVSRPAAPRTRTPATICTELKMLYDGNTSLSGCGSSILLDDQSTWFREFYIIC
jgi:hypothetical protein